MKHETLYCRQSGNMSHWSKFLFAGAVLFLSNFSTFLNFARYWGLKRVPPHIKKPQWTGRYHKERLKYAMLFRLRFQLKFLGTSWKMFLWSNAAQEYIHKVLKYVVETSILCLFNIFKPIFDLFGDPGQCNFFSPMWRECRSKFLPRDTCWCNIPKGSNFYRYFEAFFLRWHARAVLQEASTIL